MAHDLDIKGFQQAVAQELIALQRRQPEWFPSGPYADPLWPMEALERREAERLARRGRAERGAWRERTRERVAREQERPWREQDRWELRKRVWKERRDHERALLEQRERELLERDDELAQQFAQHVQWLDELQTLEQDAHAWCVELAELIEEQSATIADLNELWQRRKRAARRQARRLLACNELRSALGVTVSDLPRDAAAIAQAITPPLVGCTVTGVLPLLPVLFAAIALEIEHINKTGLRAEER
jgi:hypothetical protein